MISSTDANAATVLARRRLGLLRNTGDMLGLLMRSLLMRGVT